MFECAVGEARCGGACIKLESDSTNCGACGRNCPFEASCQSGECVCPDDLTPCVDACVDILTDELHCGQCEHPCSLGQSCGSGVCE